MKRRGVQHTGATVMWTAGLLLTTGCGRWLGKGCGSEPEARPYVLPGSDVVIATVNDAGVTEYDVEQLMAENFSELDRMAMNDDTRNDLIDVLVRTKAIAQAQAKELTAAEKMDLELRVARFKEKELVRRQLESEPVSQNDVEAFYKKHPEKFGARTAYSCELLSSERPLNDAERVKLQRLVEDPGGKPQLADWVMQLKQEGFPMVHRAGVDDRALHPKLREALTKLSPGQATKLFFLFNTPFVLKLTEVKQESARPLNEVDEDIRVMLAPTQLAKAVDIASKEALKQVKVEYAKDAPK